MRLLTLACCVRAEAGAGTPPREIGQCLFQLFHESGSRWSIEGLGGLDGGTGGQGPPRAWPDPRAAASQSAAGSSGRGPGLGPRTDRKSHSSPHSLGPGLGIGVKSHPLKEEPRPGGVFARKLSSGPQAERTWSAEGLLDPAGGRVSPPGESLPLALKPLPECSEQPCPQHSTNRCNQGGQQGREL